MSRRLSPGILAVWLALLISLGLVITRNLDLRRRVEGLSHQLTLTFETQLGPAPGDLIAIDVQGNQTVAALADKGEPPTLVFMASGSCPFCRETMNQWRALVDRLGTSVRYVLLRLDGRVVEGVGVVPQGTFGPLAFTFSARPDLEWRTPADPSIVSYRLRYVPQTMVAKDGDVVFVKTGPLNSADLDQIVSTVGPVAEASLGAP